MCGIAGAFLPQLSRLEPQRVRAAVELMQTALHHRGPDDKGAWSSRCDTTHFVHTRLAIIDLSPGGHQPMTTPDGRYTITFNGEIYNYKALQAELVADGVSFHSNSDTEVILRLYEKHGAGCVNHLRGMYAFAIWDDDARIGFLARDGFGIKPLYYSHDAERLIFASELKALQASKLCSSSISSAALTRYFQSGSVPEPMTLLEGTQMLGAGRTLTWSPTQGVKVGRSWRMEFPRLDEGVADPAKSLRKALEDSVSAHFVSDVPVGVFLSGGIDSTAIVALSKTIGKGDLRTFSIGVNDPARDECIVAKRTAAHFGTSHTEMHLDAVSGRALFQTFLSAVDQPTIDGFNTYSVSSLARSHGMKVVLSGLGGDEMFAGYPSFVKLPQLLRMAKRLGILRGTAGSLLALASRSGPKRRLAHFLKGDASLTSAYYALRGVFPGDQATALAAHLTGKAGGEPEPEESEAAESIMANEVSRMEASLYMRNQLLRDSDVMSMAHSLELRVPLVDTALFESAAQLSTNQRLRQGKLALLDAVPEVPDWVSQAPKRGFLFPYEQWLSTPEWQADFKKSLTGLPITADSWYQKWSIFVFDQWRQRHGL